MATHPPQVLVFIKSPNDPKTTLISVTDELGRMVPLYSSTASKSSKPNVQISRLPAVGISNLQHPVPIGSGTIRSLASTIDMMLRGQDIKMKQNQLSMSGHSFECPSVGKFAWGTRGLGSSKTLELSDSNGTKLAKLEPGLKLEVLVPCNDFILDMIVASGMVVAFKKGKDDKEGEVASEIIQAVAGF